MKPNPESTGEYARPSGAIGRTGTFAIFLLALLALPSAVRAQAPARPPADAPEALARRLDGPDWTTREAAFNALLDRGDAAVPALGEVIRSGSPGAARSARRLLFLIRWRLFPELLRRIGPLWDDYETLPPQDRILRVAALEALGMADALPLLRKVLDLEIHPAVREQASRSILSLQREILGAINVEGCALMKDAKFAEAEARFRKMLEIDPMSNTALYNLACSRSLQGDVEGALRLLEEAIRWGFRDFEQARQDADFDNLRKDPRFEELLRAGRRMR